MRRSHAVPTSARPDRRQRSPARPPGGVTCCRRPAWGSDRNAGLPIMPDGRSHGRQGSASPEAGWARTDTSTRTSLCIRTGTPTGIRCAGTVLTSAPSAPAPPGNVRTSDVTLGNADGRAHPQPHAAQLRRRDRRGEHQDAVLRRRDGANLFLGLRSREESVRSALGVLARLLVAASLDPSGNGLPRRRPPHCRGPRSYPQRTVMWMSRRH
jgi:hypothetical protein